MAPISKPMAPSNSCARSCAALTAGFWKSPASHAPRHTDDPELQEFLSSQMRGHKRSFSRLVITPLSGGPSSVNQQRRAGGKFRCVGSKVKDGSREFFARAEPTHRVLRCKRVPPVAFFARDPVDHIGGN